MKITRTLPPSKEHSLGVFELTPEELREAYYEKQHEFDIQDVECVFDGIADDECADIYGITKSDAAEMYDDMAEEMRRYIDKYDMHWDEARNEAVFNVIERRCGNAK